MSTTRIRTAGYNGFLVSFGEALSEEANRAALAFRDAVDHAGWDEVEESATSLVSTYLRFDPLRTDHAAMRARLEDLLGAQDWHATALVRQSMIGECLDVLDALFSQQTVLFKTQ